MILMTRPKFFIISSAIIFILERILQPLFSFPIFIFPVFVILFVLTSKKDTDELPYIIIASFIFDFFSGFTFGWLTVAILVVFITIYLVKAFFNIDGKSPVLSLVISLIFIFEYFLLLSIKTSPRLLIFQAPLIFSESVILLIPMRFLLQRFLKPKT